MEGQQACGGFSEHFEGLRLQEEPYAPEPSANGQPPEIHTWDKYLACYMADGPDQDTLNPRKMFFEDRWILVSRIYGKGFCKKLFYHVIEWYARATNRKKTFSKLSREENDAGFCGDCRKI